MIERVTAKFPDGTVAVLDGSDRDDIAGVVVQAGLHDSEVARTVATTIYGDLIWGNRPTVTIDLPAGAVVFSRRITAPLLAPAWLDAEKKSVWSASGMVNKLQQACRRIGRAVNPSTKSLLG